jgi:hypothetical protein
MIGKAIDRSVAVAPGMNNQSRARRSARASATATGSDSTNNAATPA